MNARADVDAPYLSHKEMHTLVNRYRVTDGKGFRLKHYDPADTAGHRDRASALLFHGVERLAEPQEKLYAQDRWAVL